GFRHQLFITDQTDTDIARLELRRRHRAHVENRIRAAKDTGLRNLPCVDVVCNDTWLQLVLIAQDLMAWSQQLCFHGALAVAEPKRLRHRVLHAAATIAHTNRQTVVRFQHTWPWADAIVIAFKRLRTALPAGSRPPAPPTPRPPRPPPRPRRRRQRPSKRISNRLSLRPASRTRITSRHAPTATHRSPYCKVRASVPEP